MSSPTVPILEILVVAAPLARDLVGLICDAVASAQGEDVSLEKIEVMMAQIERKNDEIKDLASSIRAKRGQYLPNGEGNTDAGDEG